MVAATKRDVLSFLQEHQQRVRELGVRRLGLFGSFVRQEQDDDSDIDVLVEFLPDKKTFDNFMQLAFFLEDSLQRRVELVTPESLSPMIGTRILKEVEYVTFSS